MSTNVSNIHSFHRLTRPLLLLQRLQDSVPDRQRRRRVLARDQYPVDDDLRLPQVRLLELAPELNDAVFDEERDGLQRVTLLETTPRRRRGRARGERTLTWSTAISSAFVKLVAFRPAKIDLPFASTPPTSALYIDIPHSTLKRPSQLDITQD